MVFVYITSIPLGIVQPSEEAVPSRVTTPRTDIVMHIHYFARGNRKIYESYYVKVSSYRKSHINQTQPLARELCPNGRAWMVC